MSKRMVSNLLLLLTALIWGVAFVAQSEGNSVGSFTFNASRSLIAGIALLPVILFFDSKDSEKEKGLLRIFAKNRWSRKTIIGGVATGAVLFAASAFQQFGIGHTTVGKAGFITTLYVVLVPIGGLFFRKKVRSLIWGSVVVALIGMYLLCINENFSISLGDGLIFICAIGYTAHVMVIDNYAPQVDCVRMSCIQFFVCSLLSAIMMFIFEEPSMTEILKAYIPILYTGVLSSGVGYTLQIVAQKDTAPTTASLIMSLESVFAMLAGWVLLSQRLSTRELIGCGLVFAAVILAQLPENTRKKCCCGCDKGA